MNRAGKSMMKQTVWAILIFCGVLAGCSRDNQFDLVEPTQDPNAVAVGFSMQGFSLSVVDQVSSKSSEELPSGEAVRVVVFRAGSLAQDSYCGQNTYVVQAGAGAQTLVECTVDDNGRVTGLGQEMRLVPGVEYDIYTFSPARKVAVVDEQFKVAGIPDGEDFMGSKTTITLASYSPKIDISAIEHQCAQIAFDVIADPADQNLLTLSAKKISIEKYMGYPEGEFVLGEPGVARIDRIADAGAPSDFGYIYVHSFEQKSPTNFTAQGVVLPTCTNGPADPKFSIKVEALINGYDYTFTTPVINDVVFEPGMKYTWTITCKRKNSYVDLSKAPWVAAKESKVEVGAAFPLQKPANSFMVAPGAGLAIPAKLVQGTPIQGIASVELLWQAKDENQRLPIVGADKIRWNADKQQIEVSVNPQISASNAVVVAKDVDGAILWSWLLWVTPYDPSGALNGKVKTTSAVLSGVRNGAVYVYEGGFQSSNGLQSVIMDRHLGDCQVSSSSFMNPYALFFQYGRKDPFFCSNGSMFLLSTLSGEQYTYPSPKTGGSVALGVANPTTFYDDYTVGSWTPVDASVTPATGLKSDNDPCPYGWRVPGNETWSDFATSSKFSYGTYSMGASLFTVYASTGYLFDGYQPSGGYARSAKSNSGLSFVNGSTVNPNTELPLAYGYPVRCVQDAVEFPLGVPRFDEVAFSSIAGTSVSVKSRLASADEVEVTETGFVHSITDGFEGSSGTKVPIAANEDYTFTTRLLDLTAGQMLYVRAYATTLAGLTVYGPQSSVIPSGPPEMGTGTATEITLSGAKVTSIMTSDGGDPNVERGLYYSTTRDFNPTTQGTKMRDTGKGLGTYSMVLSGLAPGTTYYVKAYAKNSRSIVYASSIAFATLGAPALSQVAFSDRAANSVKVSSQLTANAIDLVGWGFECSTDAEFAVDKTTSKGVTGTPAYGSFSISYDQLTAGGLYYVRSWVLGPLGKTYSQSASVRLLQLPEVVTLGIEALIGDRATLHARVPNTYGLAARDRGFEYSKEADFTPGTGAQHSAGAGNGTAGAFTAILSGLEYFTDYYYRAYVVTEAGRVYGEQKVFGSAHNLQAFELENLALRRSRFSFGLPDDFAHYDQMNYVKFAYSSTPDPWSAQRCEFDEETSGVLSLVLSDLKINKRYYVWVVCEDKHGNELYSGTPFLTTATYTNYVKIKGKKYVVDLSANDALRVWSSGLYAAYNMHARFEDGWQNNKTISDIVSYSIDDPLKTSDFALFHCWRTRSKQDGFAGFGNSEPRTFWFLPSHTEMAQVYDAVNGGTQGTFSRDLYGMSGEYWTSTEYNFAKAYVHSLNSNQRWKTKSRLDKAKVRCIREVDWKYE